MSGSRALAFIGHEVRKMLPPTLFFAAGFNLIVITTQLLVEDYGLHLFHFLVATTGALLVGKAVLVADALPFLRRFDDSPLIVPILFKTSVYVLVVLLVRLAEALIEHLVAGGTLAGLPHHLQEEFRWHRFIAVQTWIVVLFLVYTTASELGVLVGREELHSLFFGAHGADRMRMRRRRVGALRSLARLARTRSLEELRDARTPAHGQLLVLLAELTRPSAPVATAEAGASPPTGDFPASPQHRR